MGMRSRYALVDQLLRVGTTEESPHARSRRPVWCPTCCTTVSSTTGAVNTATSATADRQQAAAAVAVCSSLGFVQRVPAEHRGADDDRVERETVLNRAGGMVGMLECEGWGSWGWEGVS